MKKIMVVAVGFPTTIERDIIMSPDDDLKNFKKPILCGLVTDLKARYHHIPFTDFNIDYLQGEPGKVLAGAVQSEISRNKPDLIFTIASSARLAAKVATESDPALENIPIVFVVVSDPVDEGAVDDLNSPGENTTGVSSRLRHTVGKFFEEFLKKVPTLKNGTVVLIHQPFFPPAIRARQALRKIAKRENVAFKCFIAWDRDYLLNSVLPALPSTGNPPSVGLLMIPDDLVVSEGVAVISAAQGKRIPTFVQVLELVDKGATGGYGVPGEDVGKAAVDHVHNIVWGNFSPAGLRVEEIPDSKFIVK